MTVPQTHLSHPKYRPDIDGLRAVAVLAVVAFHAFPGWLRGGFVGVDVFFVISGYLISTIIFENFDKDRFSFSEFYARRIRRIFPALIIVLVACLAVGWFVLLADELNQLGKHVAAGAGFVSNLVLWNEAGYFDNSAHTKPLLHLWSLGVEEQFYIVWPLLLWLAWKRKFNFLAVTTFVAIVSFVLNVQGVKHDAVAPFYSPQTRFWELSFGSLLAWFALYKSDASANIRNIVDGFLASMVGKDKQESDRKIISNIFSFVGLVLLLYGSRRIHEGLSIPGKWALVPVLGTVLIIAAGQKAWINRKILSNKIAVWFGLISFPLYLWHWPLLSFPRIIDGETPGLNIRIAAVVLSIVLAWLTVKVIEKPFRFGNQKTGLKVATLCGLMFVIGMSGFVISKADLWQSHSYDKIGIKRKNFDYAFGGSLNWYRGKGDWLFLGNFYDSTVAKLRLANLPSAETIAATKEVFLNLAKASAPSKTQVVLIVGPNKSTIYPEYLPARLVPSFRRYISFFLDALKDVPNLTVYDPTDHLLSLKKAEGLLYWMTDTHWNEKGAFFTYSGFSKHLSLPVPQVEFRRGSPHRGDLIGISKQEDFPLHTDDSWEVVWKNKPVLTHHEIPNEQEATFGVPEVVVNQHPFSNKYVWVIGDSFTVGLKPYFNATFREVRYVGHWQNKLRHLPAELAKADRKPDLIVIVRVERSF